MNQPFPYQAALFDMDGVVCDNMPLHRRIWTDFVRARGLDPSEAEIKALDGRRAADIIAALFGDLPAAEVERLAAEREEIYRQALPGAELPPVTGIHDFLKWLGDQGIPRILATSAARVNVDVVLDRLRLHGAFDAIVTAADVTKGKPDPEVYLKAAGRAHADPARCLVCEDALPGVEAGAAAGATVLGIATSEPPESLIRAGARFTTPDFGFLASGTAPWV